MATTRRNHHASPQYLAAVALLEEVLSDGNPVADVELMDTAEARGIPLEKIDLACGNLGVIITGGAPGQPFYYRFPLVRRPRTIPARVWALEFLKMALGNGEQAQAVLLDWADEYNVDWPMLIRARAHLGVLKRRAYLPVEGSEMQEERTFWRLPDA